MFSHSGVFAGDIQGVGCLCGFVESACVCKFYELLPMFRQIAEGDDGELVNNSSRLFNRLS